MAVLPAAEPVTFASLGLDERLCAALTALGYEEPTPIQKRAIPALLAGRDVRGLAATGTGKTAAFSLPMLHRLAAEPATAAPAPGAKAFSRRPPRALVLVPTRELAMQVAEAVHKYGKSLGLRALPVYGGQDIGRQLRALRDGVDVVIATPGRALDHVRRGSLDLAAVRYCVLDEADEMLDMGFAEDLQAILAEMPEGGDRQTALFSATMPRAIADIAARHLRNPESIDLAERGKRAAPSAVRQIAYLVLRAHKIESLVRILDVERPPSAIVFCRTRIEVDQLNEALVLRGHLAEGLHGGLSQDQRDRVMKRFRAGKTNLLIATDVAARGLDISSLSHVINYEIPTNTEDYLHRIGRTGRAGKSGTALSLVEPREHRLLRNFEHATGQKIELATLPTVADLRARRLELLSASVREAVVAGGFDRFRGLAEGLAEGGDFLDVLAATLKLLHDEKTGGAPEDEHEIVTPVLRDRAKPERPRFERGERPGPGEARFERFERSERPGHSPDAAAPAEGKKRHPHPMRAGKQGGPPGPPEGRRERRPQSFKVARLWIGAGRNYGIRPGDLVGAIANECNLPARAIGAVEIGDTHSLVELPDEVVDEVAGILSRAWIKGKKVNVRRDKA